MSGMKTTDGRREDGRQEDEDGRSRRRDGRIRMILTTRKTTTKVKNGKEERRRR